MYYVGFNQGEKYFLRMLLTVVRGPKSFQDLHTYEDIVHPTFKECCAARGMLDDDREWTAALTEAALIQSGYQLRSLLLSSV